MDIVNEEIEQNKIPANRIVIGGFSQGCVLGMLTALTSEHKFAGVVGLSGYMPLHEKIMDIATQANRETHIFWGHGGSDPVNIEALTISFVPSIGVTSLCSANTFVFVAITVGCQVRVWRTDCPNAAGQRLQCPISYIPSRSP